MEEESVKENGSYQAEMFKVATRLFSRVIINIFVGDEALPEKI